MTEFLLRLKEDAKIAGITLSDDLGGMLALHWQMLTDANTRFNLTAIRDPQIAAQKHYLDCLIAAEMMRPYFAKGGSGADIGSGGGFPGLIMAAVYPESNFTLIESAQKKAAFLADCAAAMKVTNIGVIPCRVEDAGHDVALRNNFSFVSARAVANLRVLVEYALPLMTAGGIFFAMKGPETEEEILSAGNALEMLGASVEITLKYELPLCHEGRSLIIIRKTGPTLDKYPRRAGLPTKRPL